MWCSLHTQILNSWKSFKGRKKSPKISKKKSPKISPLPNQWQIKENLFTNYWSHRNFKFDLVKLWFLWQNLYWTKKMALKPSWEKARWYNGRTSVLRFEGPQFEFPARTKMNAYISPFESFLAVIFEVLLIPTLLLEGVIWTPW